jgi:LemA protein
MRRYAGSPPGIAHLPMNEIALLTLLPIAAVCLWAGVAFTRTFNRFVAARNACSNARAGIDVQLTKRHDLVPNLARAVGAYSAHEREVLELVSRARASATTAFGTASSPAAEAGLDRALTTLSARVEAYPALKASDNFMQLQRTLTEIEEQISAARRTFNAHALTLNNLAEQFPTSIVAHLVGFATIDYFVAAADARATPPVAFDRHAV